MNIAVERVEGPCHSSCRPHHWSHHIVITLHCPCPPSRCLHPHHPGCPHRITLSPSPPIVLIIFVALLTMPCCHDCCAITVIAWCSTRPCYPLTLALAPTMSFTMPQRSLYCCHRCVIVVVVSPSKSSLPLLLLCLPIYPWPHCVIIIIIASCSRHRCHPHYIIIVVILIILTDLFCLAFILVLVVLLRWPHRRHVMSCLTLILIVSLTM